MFCFVLLSHILEFSDKKISFATDSKVGKTILPFFQNSFAVVCVKSEHTSPLLVRLLYPKFFLPLTFQPRSSLIFIFNTTVEFIVTKPNFFGLKSFDQLDLKT